MTAREMSFVNCLHDPTFTPGLGWLKETQVIQSEIILVLFNSNKNLYFLYSGSSKAVILLHPEVNKYIRESKTLELNRLLHIVI